MSRERQSAADLIALVLDGGSYTSWDSPVDISGFDADYQEALARAAQRAGTDEAVVTGAGTIDGLPVAVIVGEFGFLGGSIGVQTAQRITAAVRRATAEGLPLIAATSSGGTRMQEGTPAFVKMVTISRAIVAHKAAGLPYLVYLRHPTTGGVFASWGSLGHVTVAEPGALVGFLGPKVYEALNGEPFPQGVQLAENLVEKGVIDAVVPTDQLAPLASRVLRMLHPSVPVAVPVEASIRCRPARRARRRARRRSCGRRCSSPEQSAGPECASCCATPPTTSSRSRAPVRVSRIRASCWRSRRSEGCRASSSGRTGATRCTRRWVRRRYERPAAGCSSPRDSGYRSSLSSTPPARICRPAPRRAPWPARSPAPSPN